MQFARPAAVDDVERSELGDLSFSVRDHGLLCHDRDDHDCAGHAHQCVHGRVHAHHRCECVRAYAGEDGRGCARGYAREYAFLLHGNVHECACEHVYVRARAHVRAFLP